MKKGNVIIVCKNKSHHGMKLNLPDIGKTDIGEDGQIEVSEEVAKMLVTKTADWTYLNPPVEDETEEESDKEFDEDNDKAPEEEEEGGEEDINDEELDKELTKALIKNFDEKQLRKIALNQAGLSKAVIDKGKTKAALAQMIVNKLSNEDKEQLLEKSKGE